MLSRDLQVYKDSYNLFHVVMDIIAILPRVLKYSLGQRMIDNATRMMEEIDKANCSYYNQTARLQHINEARTALRILDLHLRLCYERHAVSHKINAEYAKFSALVGKQLTGWATRASKA